MGKYDRPGLYKKFRYKYRFEWVISFESQEYRERLDVVFNKLLSSKRHTQFLDMMYRCIMEQDIFVAWFKVPGLLTFNRAYGRYYKIYVCPVLLKSYSDTVLWMYLNDTKYREIKDLIQKEILLRRLTGERPWVGIVTRVHKVPGY